MMKDKFSNLPFVLLFVIFSVGCAHVPPSQTAERPFDFKHDTFAFANETIWNYEGGSHRADTDEEAGGRKRYTWRCFVMTRAAVQFWKFARFEPKQPVLGSAELATRIRSLTRIDVWRKPLSSEERIVFPGYLSLRQMSLKERTILQDNIGLGWPTCFRLANFCIFETPSQAHQARTHAELQMWLERNQPMILWVYNFPKRDINHVVIAFGKKNEGGHLIYLVYDPNYRDRPLKLEYHPDSQTFTFQKTFYFQGGLASVRSIFLSMLQ